LNSAKKLSVVLDMTAAQEIAQRARGTPRIANRLLRRVRDYAQVKTQGGPITLDVVLRAMGTLGIDEEGLDEVDRRLMSAMRDHYQGGPVGVEAIAATLNEEVDTVVDVVEPFLLKRGFLKRTPRGRELTAEGLKHIGANLTSKKHQKELFE